MTFRQAVWTMVFCLSSRVVVQAEPVPAVLAPAAEKMELKKKQLGHIQPVHALGNIFLAGQPTMRDLLLLKRHGIKTVITLRKTNEIDWDEAAAVERLGMKFVQAPFQTPQELKTQIFDAVLKVLRDKKRGPTVLHCASANRVGAVWYAYRVLDGKLSPEAALAEAKIVGLRTPEYLDQARTYIKQVRQAKQKSKTVAVEP